MKVWLFAMVSSIVMEEDLLFVSSIVDSRILALSIDDSGDTGATACDAVVLLVTATTWPTC